MHPRLFISSGSALLLGWVPEGCVHSHLAVQLVVGLTESFTLEVDAVDLDCRGAVVASNVAHLLRPGPGGVLMLLIDPTSETAASQSSVARGAPVHVFEASSVDDIARSAARLLQDTPPPEEVEGVRRSMTSLLAPATTEEPTLDATDPRVRQVLAHLDAHRAGEEVWDLERLAAEVSLSPSRLRHLFRAQVGLPVRSYRTWARMRRAVLCLARGESLTRAAHSAGFVDSGHLSRAFRQMFGIAPSSLTSSGDITQL